MHVIRQKRAEVGEAIFSAQYQQNPSAAIGELIKPDQIRHFGEVPPSANRLTLSWDTAVKTGPNTSYTVCLVFATDGKCIMLLMHYARGLIRCRRETLHCA